MERMTDYKPQERQDLEELYRKQNVRINELEQCNLNLQEWLDNKEKVNKSLREENKKLNERIKELEDVSKDYDLLSKDFIALGEENKKLKEELSKLKEKYGDLDY